MTGILQLFRKTFNRVQYVFVVFWIIFNICDNLSSIYTLNHQSDHLTAVAKNWTFHIIGYYLYLYDKHYKFWVFHKLTI